MNKERREMLMDAEGVIEEAIGLIQDVIDEEQTAYDSLPDSLVDSERGQDMCDAIDDMGDLVDSLEDVGKKLRIIIGGHGTKASSSVQLSSNGFHIDRIQ